jgi:hypothetical protein
VSLEISVTDRCSPMLRRIMNGLSEGALGKLFGTAGVDFLRAHFFKLDQERPNAMGGKRTHFYGRVARSCTYEVTLTGSVMLSAGEGTLGLAQRIHGGEIHPVNAKWLTTPARKEAYGKRAREFSNLRLAFFGRGKMALVEAESVDITFGRKRKAGSRKVTPGQERGGAVMFWLRKSVTQQPDPSVAPNLRALEDACLLAGEEYEASLINRAEVEDR